MYSIAEIVKRYNDSVSDYAAYKVALHEHQPDVQAQHLRNAGEGLSQVLEHALKLQLQLKDPASFPTYRKCKTPFIVESLFLHSSGVQKSLYATTLEAGVAPTVDFDYLRMHKFQLTNDSKHEGGVVEPTVVEEYIKQCKLFITEYLDKNALLRDVAYFMEAKQDQIQEFYVACDHFQRDDRTYILLSDKVDGLDKHCYKHFAKAPWDVIVDFHQQSADSGLSAGAYNGGADVPHIYKTGDVVTTEDITASLRKPLYYYANGFKGERTCATFDEWNRSYYHKLELFLDAFSKSVTTQKTIVVSLLQDEEYIESILLLVNRYFSNVKFVIANDPNDTLLPLARRKSNSYVHVRTSIEEIGKCINEYLINNETVEGQPHSYSVPYIHGEGSGTLCESELQDLQECFEVLYTHIGEGTDEEAESFLRGETILTWQGAKRGFAAKRERYQRMYEKPLETIIKNGRNKVYLLHEPGFGGTTVARQLAYDFRENYPVLYLKEYRYTAVQQKLDWLHERTKKTIVVFMEIPSVISADDFEYLFRSTNQSRPYVFVGVMRGKDAVDNNIHVTDWGLDTVLLADKYRPIIESRYSGSEKTGKLNEIQSILTGVTTDTYKRTPFYFGLLTYEKDFVAADGFFEKFVRAVERKEKQRKFLIYLALSDVYADKPLPEALFRTVFGVSDKHIFKLENYFNDDDGILNSLVQVETVGNVRLVRPKYAFFSEKLLRKLLRKAGSPEDTGWYSNLGTYCKEFIEDVARSGVADILERDVIQPMFIGSSKERDGEHFTRLVDDIQKEDRINIFSTLHIQFPENPHFCSHLARFYSMEEKNMEKALDYADRAIRLSPNDPLLHHMKGMCLFYIIGERMDIVRKSLKVNTQPDPIELNYITENLLLQAEAEFQKSREIQQKAHHDDEYGYIPNIKLLLRVFDFYVQVNGETKRRVIANAKEPYITWLDRAHTLLEDARRMHEEGEESEHFLTCETNLWQEYEDYSGLLEKLNNQLTQTKHPAFIRRQLAQIYMRRDEDYKSNPKINERILTLMSDNMKNDGTSIVNFLLWFKAARYSSLTTDEILTRLVQWNTANPAMDLSFYIFVFNAIKAIEGSTEAAERARRALQECQKLGGNNRIGIREWYGDAQQGIVSNYERKNKPSEYDLYEVEGYVKDYQHPGNAVIQLDCGLEVFFKPSVKGITQSSMNHRVRFVLGFSYDGLRADSESVEVIG